jgi:hypothetical protein
MVINGKLWDAQEDYIEAHVLLREHPFDYIITGDNHTSFDVSVGGRQRFARKELLGWMWPAGGRGAVACVARLLQAVLINDMKPPSPGVGVEAY